MTRPAAPLAAIALCALLGAALALSAAQGGDEAPMPFAPSALSTESGRPLPADWGYSSADCAECHPRQHDEWKGSMHSRAHEDGLYLAFAKRARQEGGEAMYRFCSGCHAPAAVASGEIPGGPGRAETHHTSEGVSCSVCHSVASVRTRHAGGGANGSIVLGSGDVMFGPIADPASTPAHESQMSPVHRRSELCSACHTLTHPANGVVIENTFEEWSQGPYAAAGVQCQDCHMRTVDEALVVARGMRPIQVAGRTTGDPETRPDVHAHTFVGGNANVRASGVGERHAAEAVKRLRGAATVALSVTRTAAGALAVEVAVTNASAGHAIPTSITELRQAWIDLRVTDAAGAEVFRSGAVDASGRVDPGAVMYHSVLADAEGKVTYLPWRAAKILKEKLIPPKATVRERYDVPVPEGAPGPLQVAATLRYRSAPQEVLDDLFGKGALPVETVDMAAAGATAP